MSTFTAAKHSDVNAFSYANIPDRSISAEHFAENTLSRWKVIEAGLPAVLLYWRLPCMSE